MTADRTTNALLKSLITSDDIVTEVSVVEALNREELFSLGVALWKILPKRQMGHGVETFEGPLKYNETSSDEQRRLLQLWFRLNNTSIHLTEPLPKPFEAPPKPEQNPLKEPVDFAIQYLNQCGLDFEGWETTYLFFDIEDGDMRQVERATYEEWRKASTEQEPADTKELRIIVDSLEHAEEIKKEFQDAGISLPSIVVAEQTTKEIENLYRVRSIKSHYQVNNFEEFTPFWHAVNILHWYHECYMAEWKNAIIDRFGTHYRRNVLANSLQCIALSAFEIGRSYEALKKKKFEGAALTGLKVKSGLRAAATATNLKHRNLRSARFSRIAQLVDQFGLDQAARICEREGLGGWQGIKKQWQRRKENRDM